MSLQFHYNLIYFSADRLLDEWIGTTNVDKSSEDGLLQRINANTDIVVLASHNKQLIRRLCNKVIYLCRGRLVYFGPNKNHAYSLLAGE